MSRGRLDPVLAPPPTGLSTHGCLWLGQGPTAVVATHWAAPQGPLQLSVARGDPAGTHWTCQAQWVLEDRRTPSGGALMTESAVVIPRQDVTGGDLLVLPVKDQAYFTVPFVEGLSPGPLCAVADGVVAAAHVPLSLTAEPVSGPALYHAAIDPISGEWGPWRPAADPAFGHPGNLGITALAVRGTRLYAATLNPDEGFEVWAADTGAPPPWSWHRLLTQGAWRHALNRAVTALAVLEDTLWLGTAILSPTPFSGGNEAPEILAVDGRDRPDLVVGALRVSPEGLMVPRALCGPGFGEPVNAAITAFAGPDAHGRLLACCQRPGAEGAYSGEAVIWASRDGRTWEPVAIAPPILGAVGQILPVAGGLLVGRALGPDRGSAAVARLAP